MTIIKANKSHLKEITEITNYSIINTNFNFNIKPKTLNDTEVWFEEHLKNDLPIIVYLKDNKVLGWGCLSTFRNYPAYNKTVELSVYVHNDYYGMGIGTLLIKELENLAKQKNLHCIISAITCGNDASINLHKKLGFKVQGIFKEVGFKNNQFLDVIFLYKLI